MSAAMEITDLATPMLQRIASKMQHPQPLLAAAGAGVETELHRHFDERNAEGNKQGWTRSDFWLRKVKDHTRFQGATDREATVSIASREFLHKLRGGTITAKSGKMLAIPLSDFAKRMGSPREWNDRSQLFVIKTTSQAFLARKTGNGEGKGAIEFLYLLKHSVTQIADPRALPPIERLQGALDRAVTDFVNANVQGGTR